MKCENRLSWLKFHLSLPYSKLAEGIVVRLINDETKKEYTVIRTEGISRGPVGQFSPSITFFVRCLMFGYEGQHEEYWYFRKDSLEVIR